MGWLGCCDEEGVSFFVVGGGGLSCVVGGGDGCWVQGF